MIVAPETDISALQMYALSNRRGMTMTVTNFGGRIMSLCVPDKNGKSGDVVLGYDSPKEYLNGNPYYGSMIGRYANRIANGKFPIGDKEYSLVVNDGENTLHSGPVGFHRVYWTESAEGRTSRSLQMEYLSKDGDDGFPGNLAVVVRYTLTDDQELILDYTATTDKSTVVSLTNHSYFNLAGEGNGDILNHELMINGDDITVVGPGLIPTGEKRKVEGTPFDFRKLRKIREQINSADEQLQLGKGYDHNWILNKGNNALTLAAEVVEPVSGRVMEVLTTEPGLQFYSGNFLDGDRGKGGKPYHFRTGFCLEAQHFPDTPNHADFPPALLQPGAVYSQKTIYKFSVLK